MSRWANLKYGLVLILITLTPFSFYGLFWGIKSLSWVPLEAQIVKVSRIERSGSNLPVPEIRVVYQYIINGKKLTKNVERNEEQLSSYIHMGIVTTFRKTRTLENT